MAEFFVDSSTALQATNLNRVVVGDTYANGYYMALAYQISYNGATWAIANRGANQSDGDVSVAWDGVNYKLDIDLSGLTRVFTGEPVIVVSSLASSTHAAGPTYLPQARTSSATDLVVRFVDLTSPSAYVTTQSTDMAFMMIVYGNID